MTDLLREAKPATVARWRERNCLICKAAFQPKSHNHAICSWPCEAKRRRDLQVNGWFFAARVLIYQRDEGTCYICLRAIPREKPNSWHVDHVRQLNHGGSSGPENRAIACRWCNLSRAKDRHGLSLEAQARATERFARPIPGWLQEHSQAMERIDQSRKTMIARPRLKVLRSYKLAV